MNPSVRLMSLKATKRLKTHIIAFEWYLPGVRVRVPHLLEAHAGSGRHTFPLQAEDFSRQYKVRALTQKLVGSVCVSIVESRDQCREEWQATRQHQ